MFSEKSNKYIRRVETMTVADFQRQFATEEQCYKHLFNKLWPKGFVCPKCKTRKHYYQESRRLYHCKACSYQASLTAGTVFHKSRLPLWKWYWAIYRISQDKKGLSAMELMKEIVVSYPTAWLILQN